MADLSARHGNSDDKVQLLLAECKRQALVTIFQQSAEALLAIEPPPRHSFGEMARAIGRLRSPELLPVLERMLDKDLGALREQQHQPGVRYLFTNQYSRAFEEIGTPAVIPILTARLTEVDFGFAAAFAIENLSDRESGRPDQTSVARWPNSLPQPSAGLKRPAPPQERMHLLLMPFSTQ